MDITITVNLDDQEIIDAFWECYLPPPIINERGMPEPSDIEPADNVIRVLQNYVVDTVGRVRRDIGEGILNAQIKTDLSAVRYVPPIKIKQL